MIDPYICCVCDAPAPTFSVIVMRPKSANAAEADSAAARICATCIHDPDRSARALAALVDAVEHPERVALVTDGGTA